MTALLTERLTPMANDLDDALTERLEALDRRRRKARPRVTIERLLKAAGYEGNQTWYDTLNGKRPIETVERFEEALDELIVNPEDIDRPEVVEPDVAVVPGPEGLIEIDLDITGDFGVTARAIVKGPVSNPEAVAEAAAKILREIRGAQGSSND